MSGHDIIVVGASAGGVEALSQLVRDLPPDLAAAIFVVLHIPPQGKSVLPKILNRSLQKRQGSSLLATHPYDGETIQHGRIYVAPPDHHLIIKDGYICLARGPKENSHRPAVDPLFRTAARVYGPRVIGVVLSGTLDDGTAGLVVVKKRGGVAVVQNPDEAQYSGMPSSAIENVDVDHILQVSDMAPVLVELTYKPVEEERAEAVSSDMEMESDMAELELRAMQSSDRPGTPSPFACPECAGVLWELDEGGVIRFRCRTGHAYSMRSLLAEQAEALEVALWSALRALEEKAALVQRMAIKARDRNQNISAKRFEEQGQDAQQRAVLLRQMLLKGGDNGQVEGSKDLASAVVSEPTRDNFTDFSVVAICVSADQMKALSQVLSGLPTDFPAAITVVHDWQREQPSQMVDILSRSTTLIVKEAESGDMLHPGTVYIAPPNKHMLVNPDSTLSLSYSKLVHFVHPSADLLFESVAATFKQRAIAVVLTGKSSDGVMGVRAIKEMGGTTIAQEQANSQYFGMPPQQIADTLVKLVTMKNEEIQA